VIVSDDSVTGHAGTTQGATEASFCAGAVSFVAQQNVDELAMLINRAREGAFLFAAEAEHVIHVPQPSHSSSCSERLPWPIEVRRVAPS